MLLYLRTRAISSWSILYDSVNNIYKFPPLEAYMGSMHDIQDMFVTERVNLWCNQHQMVTTVMLFLHVHCLVLQLWCYSYTYTVLYLEDVYFNSVMLCLVNTRCIQQCYVMFGQYWLYSIVLCYVWSILVVFNSVMLCLVNTRCIQ